MKKITLFILDDHQMLIDGIKALLKNESQFIIIGESTNALDALCFFENQQPDIVISDINMPEMGGVEFTKIVRDKFPTIKLLALSMFSEKSIISEMLDAGVNGYILKNTGKAELVNALLKIAQGGLFYSDEVSTIILKAISERNKEQNNNPKVVLTQRELEIIQLIANEFNNAQIGDKLFISERTVETHRKNIFRKTNTKTVVGLIKFAIEQKLIQ